MAHQHYKGTGKMHSFRGLLADGGQDKIRIQGATGEIAWRITKFQLMHDEPGEQHVESTVKVYREEQTTINNNINFGDDELLGASYLAESDNHENAVSITTIFDNALFSRNIYVTHQDTLASRAINYYIELEEVKVSAAGMAQLSVAAARRLGLNP